MSPDAGGGERAPPREVVKSERLRTAHPGETSCIEHRAREGPSRPAPCECGCFSVAALRREFPAPAAPRGPPLLGADLHDEPSATPTAPPGKRLPATPSAHAGPEPVLVLPLAVAGPVGWLHGLLPVADARSGSVAKLAWKNIQTPRTESSEIPSFDFTTRGFYLACPTIWRLLLSLFALAWSSPLTNSGLGCFTRLGHHSLTRAFARGWRGPDRWHSPMTPSSSRQSASSTRSGSKTSTGPC